MQAIKVPTSKVAQFLTGYRKREAYVEVSSSVNVESYWDGGSKSDFMLVNETGRRIELKEGGGPFSKNPHGNHHVMQPGEILIETSVFCSKTGTAHIHFHSEEQLRRIVKVEEAVAV